MLSYLDAGQQLRALRSSLGSTQRYRAPRSSLHPSWTQAKLDDVSVTSQISSGANFDFDSIRRRLEQLYESSKSGEQVNVAEISRLHKAILLLPSQDNIKAELLNTLGDVCSKHHESMEKEDLNRAVGIYNDAVREASHNFKPKCWNDLGICLAHRYECLGDLADLNRSIQLFEEVVQVTPNGHPDKSGHMNNLGISLQRRFERLDDLSDINRSIQLFEEVVQLTPNGHPDKPGHINNLGISLQRRFERLDGLSDIDRSIQLFEEVVRLTPNGHPIKLVCLINLGILLLHRFELLDDLSDLNRSIQVTEDAVRLMPDAHPDRPDCLTNLSILLLRRFERLGDLANLDNSIQVTEDAVLFTPNIHPARPRRLINLGILLLHRFKRLGDIADLNKSIQATDDAVLLTPDGHPDRPHHLTNLGISLQRRFEQLGNLSDLDRSIQAREDAVQLTPDGNSDKPLCLNNLGSSLIHRFERLDNLSDLDRSIQIFKDVVQLTPDGHPDKPDYLTNLGTSLLHHFKRLGDPSDLNRSIQVTEDAVRLTPDEHPDKPGRLTNLGASLLCRFEWQGDLADRTRSIQAFEDLVQLIPDRHPSEDTQSALSTFWTLLQPFFEQMDGQDNKNVGGFARHNTETSLHANEQLEKELLLSSLQTRFVTATAALDHINRHAQDVEAVMRENGISVDQYIVRCGFDANLIVRGVGLLERIYVLLSVDIPETSKLPTVLGQKISPYPGVLITPAGCHQLPTFQSGGEPWDLDDLIMRRTVHISGRLMSTSASTTSLSDTALNNSNDSSMPSMSSQGCDGNGNKNDDSGSGDGDGNGDRPDRSYDPGDHGDGPGSGNDGPGPSKGKEPVSRGPRAHFQVTAEVYCSTKTLFQKFETSGTITTRIGEEYPPEDQMSESQVKFLQLNFQTQPHGTVSVNSAYQQYFCHVTVDTTRKCARVMHASPSSTPNSDRSRRETTTKEVRWIGTLSAACKGIFAIPSFEITGLTSRTAKNQSSSEVVKYTSRIVQKESSGTASWRFFIDDDNMRENGLKLDDDKLPSVKFEFFGDDGSTPLSTTFIEVASYWSIPVPKSWTPFSSCHTEPLFQNICHVVAMELPTNMTRSANYIAVLKKRPSAQDETLVETKIGPLEVLPGTLPGPKVIEGASVPALIPTLKTTTKTLTPPSADASTSVPAEVNLGNKGVTSPSEVQAPDLVPTQAVNIGTPSSSQ